MLPKFHFEPTEGRLQQALFIELLHLAPTGTELYITSDSWEELPVLLGQRMTVLTENEYEQWVVALTPESCAFLVHQDLHDDIQLTFVHFALKANQRNLFLSYDRMVVLELDPDFPEYERLVETYAPILML